ncbi:MAG: helix-turn-helix transcriptional regulator, partial [Gordonia sp. (in: high G+C Gram-positive bacteria)]
ARAGRTDRIPGRIDRAGGRGLGLIARGLSNRQLAGELVVSMSTVKTHINHILAKTACDSRAALVSDAYTRQLI